MATTSKAIAYNDQTSWESGSLTGVKAPDGVLAIADDPVLYLHEFETLGGWADDGLRGGTLSVIDGPGRKGKVARTSGGVTWWSDKDTLLPYDPAKLYEVSARIRQVSDAVNNNAYIGIQGVAANGTTLVNIYGQDSASSQHYVASSSYNLESAAGWKTFRGYFSGHATGMSGPRNDPNDPMPLHTNVAYIRPLVLLCYDGAGGTAEVDYVQIREIAPPTNLALNCEVTADILEKAGKPASIFTNGSRDTQTYAALEDYAGGARYLTVDLGAPKLVDQIGVFHYRDDGRTYYGTRLQVSNGLGGALHDTPSPLLDYSTWVEGTTGDQGVFSAQGLGTQSVMERGGDPFYRPATLWACRPDTSSDADGGFGAAFPADDATTYRLSIFVRKSKNLTDGSTYFGCDNTDKTLNLSGTVNDNPYFWSGDLPTAENWYLMVGVVHPNDYSGGDAGIAGVYDMTGNRVIDGTEFKSAAGITEQMMRAYLYYTTTNGTKQEFVYPRVDVMDGSEPTIHELVRGVEWLTVFDASRESTYAESASGRWHGVEPQYVRYIRDRLDGNSVNSGHHWVELEAYGTPAKPQSGERLETLAFDDVGRVASTQISWKAHKGLMLGKGSFVYFPPSPQFDVGNELTIEAWVCWGPNSSLFDDRGTILTNATSYYFQILNDGRLACYTYWSNPRTNSAYTESVNAVKRGEWTHVAFTENDAGMRRLYINGVEDKADQKEDSITPASSNPRPTGIGWQVSDFGTRELYAGIHHVRLWSVAKTTSELATNMRAEMVGDEPNLIGEWKLNEMSGSVAFNSTGQLHGEIVNPRWVDASIETNVSLDGGVTWLGWKPAVNGGPIPDVPADADGYKLRVDCRQTLSAPEAEVTPTVESLTVDAAGNKTVAKVWLGGQWVETPQKVRSQGEWVPAQPRVFVNGRWL